MQKPHIINDFLMNSYDCQKFKYNIYYLYEYFTEDYLLFLRKTRKSFN